MVMEEFRHLTRVRISAGGIDSCAGRVEDIRRPEDLPEIEGFDQAGENAPVSILREWGVTRVAVISYEPDPNQQCVFTALEIAGEWYDMRRQKLTFEVIGQYQWPDLPRN
jgi:hypothetical protein